LRVLITGADGFVGKHLAAYFTKTTDIEPHGTTFGDPKDFPATDMRNLASLHQIDIRDENATTTLIEQLKPDSIIHLAALTHVHSSFRNPWATLETNIRGSLNILETLRNSTMQDIRLLMISSSEIYGVVQPEDLPISENQLPNPGNPYSVSKVAQELLARQYYLAHQLNIVNARAFNHIGPGQDNRFALPNFASQIIAIERGKTEPTLHVGNLDAARDFTDVRDIVRAYHLLLIKGKAGQTYNICQGKSYVLRDLVDQLIELATVNIQVQVDTERLRPLDVPEIVGDPSRIHEDTGWQAEIPMTTTLEDILNDWRTRE
jgi:GDP-4-dehydro-6-deoxy-D-mannose reductase